MKYKITGIALLVIILVSSLFILRQLPAKKSYDRLRSEAESPMMQSVSIEGEEQAFLDDVQRNWKIALNKCPDQSIISMCELTEFEPNVEGWVQMHTHEIPHFHFLTRPGIRRNPDVLVHNRLRISDQWICVFIIRKV
jgi:hypothetical protein